MERYPEYFVELKVSANNSLTNVFRRHNLSKEDTADLRADIITAIEKSVGNYISAKDEELKFREAKIEEFENAIKVIKKSISEY